MKQTSSGNLIAIQILRCFAALLVVVWHSHISIRLFSQDYWPDGDYLFRALHYPSWANHLYAGVDLFFCISGFIMSMLADRTKWANAGAFIIDRFARILPPYWFFTIAVIAVYLLNPRFNIGGLTGSWGQDALPILKSFLLVPQDQQPVLGVGWTLIHEFLFYYLVAILIFLKQGQRIAPHSCGYSSDRRCVITRWCRAFLRIRLKPILCRVFCWSPGLPRLRQNFFLLS
jgi:exopolysaccharide production protein ExoZ